MLHPESIRQSPSGGIRLPDSSSKHRFAHSGHRFTLTIVPVTKARLPIPNRPTHACVGKRL